MLVAELDGARVEADTAVKGPIYNCLKCKAVLILKQGRKVIWHFAHKPPTDCTWATGETKAHLEAKSFIAKVLRERGVRAEIEYAVPSLSGDRRADVMAFPPRGGTQVAIELQHCSLPLPDLERRAKSYAAAGIAQVWIPFIPASVWKDGDWKRKDLWHVERYSAKPFERWIHGFNGKHGMWMYCPTYKRFWLGRLTKYEIHVPESNWYSQEGEEQYAGGFTRISKRYKELTLVGPCDFADLRISIERRNPFGVTGYNWPGGWFARLQTAK